MLNIPQINNAKILEKQYKLYDSGGLYLLIHPNGSKYWRLKYRYLGKEKVMAFGVYPSVLLKEARVKRDTAKKTLSDGDDPIQLKNQIDVPKRSKLKTRLTISPLIGGKMRGKAGKKIMRTMCGAHLKLMYCLLLVQGQLRV